MDNRRVHDNIHIISLSMRRDVPDNKKRNEEPEMDPRFDSYPNGYRDYFMYVCEGDFEDV